MTENAAPDPFLRLTVGAPVYTDDDEKLGTVKEIQNRHFKIDTPLFHRDYWLPVACIEAAVPGEIVVLAIPKTALDEFKTREPSERAA